MIFFDLIILGVYFLIKPIYLFLDKDEKNFGAEDHSLLVSWSAHSANISSVVRLLVKDSLNYKVIIVTLIVLLIILGYFIYYGKGRMKEILKIKVNPPKKALIFIFAILYVIVSIYIFFNLPYF